MSARTLSSTLGPPRTYSIIPVQNWEFTSGGIMSEASKRPVSFSSASVRTTDASARMSLA